MVTFHGYDVTRLPKDPTTGARYRTQPTELFGQAGQLVATSDFIAARMCQLGAPRTRCTGSTSASRCRLRSSRLRRGRRVLFVGRVVEVKGVEDLLTAVAMLPPHLRDVPVRLYGDGPLRIQLGQRAHQLGVRAESMGHLPTSEVRRDLAGGRVLRTLPPQRRRRGGGTRPGLP